LVGVQAQEERGARWSIGLRGQGCTEQDIIQEIENRRILRTWLFRGTLHYVACEDLSWLLDLLAPGIINANARRYEQLHLDSDVFPKSEEVILKILEVRGEATRSELKEAFHAAGVSAEGQQLPYLLQYAALNRMIFISGTRGRDMVFRLASELELQHKDFDRNSALVHLAERYFHSHGPATVHDLAWWSGLNMSDARKGLKGCVDLHELIYKEKNYYAFEQIINESEKDVAHLLSPFDEYLIAYRNRDLALDPTHTVHVNRGGGMFKPTVLINGKVAGTWQQNEKGDEISIEIRSFGKIDLEGKDAIDQAASRLSNFYQKHISLNFNDT
jgi:hypothetical protein